MRTGAECAARTGEDGSALVWAVFFVALTTGVLIAHSFEMSANRRTMDTRFSRVDRARTIATSGLTEAAAWLRRQSTQPVLQFTPQLDPQADPPVDDTLDPSVGLVREFPVHGSLWARYEVRNDEVYDVSASHGEAPGTVWDVGSRGYLFQRLDPNRPFDEAPNRVVSLQQVRTEVRGLPVDLPAGAALIVQDTSQITMLGNGTIDGKGSPGVAYRKPLIPILPILDALVTGLPISVSIDNLTLGLTDLFRLRSDKIANLCDVVLMSGRELPRRVVKDSAIYVGGQLDLNAGGNTLRGRMLLVVDGDMVANAGNNSDFSGVVYVRGNMTVKGPFRFRGTTIVGGTLEVGGTGDMVSMEYSAAEVAALQNALSRYRVSRDARPAASTGAFAPPTDLDLDAALR